MANNTFDPTAIADYAGSYGKQLINEMINDLDIVQQVPFLFNVTADQNITKYKTVAGLRPLDTDVVKASGRGSFSNRKLQPKVGMRIVSINPDDLRKTFISENLNANAPDIPVPFAEWIWRGEMNRLKQELNDNIFESEFAGDAVAFDAGAVYAASTIAAPVFVKFGTNNDIYKCITLTTAGQSPTTHPAKWTLFNASGVCDGIHTIIKKLLAASSITAVTTGALTTSNAKTKAELLFSSTPAYFKKEKSTLYMSYDVFYKYMAEAKANPNLMLAMGVKYDGGTTNLYLENSAGKCKIVVASWMGASQRMILVIDKVLIGGTDKLSDVTGIGKLIETLHGYDTIMKLIMCFQFSDLDGFYVNDQA